MLRIGSQMMLLVGITLAITGSVSAQYSNPNSVNDSRSLIPPSLPPVGNSRGSQTPINTLPPSALDPDRNLSGTIKPPGIYSSTGSEIKDIPVPFNLNTNDPLSGVINSTVGTPALTEDSMGKWKTFGEVLLWQPFRQGLSYATPSLSTTAPIGQVSSVNLPVNAGLRFGVGYEFANSKWTIETAYTYFYDSTQKSTYLPTGGVIFPTLTLPGVIDSVQQAAGSAAINYQVFDLDFSRRVFADDSFFLKVTGGMRFASIRQQTEGFYNGGDANMATALNNTNFYGTGPTLGAQGDWNILPNLNVYGNVKGGLIYGSLQGGIYESNNGNATIDANLQNQNYQVVPMMSIGTGINYTLGRFHLGLGYEMTQWFGLVQQPMLVNDFALGKYVTRHSDLSLVGFNFKFGWDF